MKKKHLRTTSLAGNKQDHVNNLIGLARQKHTDGAFAEAASLYSQIIKIIPKSWVAQNNIGVVLKELGRIDEAINAYRTALALGAPPDVYSNLGLALSEKGLLHEAYGAHCTAVRHLPASASAHSSLGAFFYSARDLAQAARCFQKAIQLNPNSAHDYLKLGTVAFESGQVRPAIGLLERAVALAPDNADGHFHLAVALLSAGNLPRGFAEYEWRRLKEGFPRPGFSQAEWRGEPLSGKTILLYAEQGLGDTLQFIRYAPMVAALGARVIVLVQPPLVRLLQRSPGISEVLSTVQKVPAFDFHLPILSLPFRLRTTLESIPANVPYLTPPPSAVEAWARRLHDVKGLKVGLVWSGNPRPHDSDAHAVDKRRSLCLDQYGPLAAIKGVTFISLQKGAAAEQAQKPPAGMPIIDLTEDLADFADTAAMVANLDLVVTVDTSVCHLVGGMGKPVHILSRFDACWRWIRGREDCPWYPTARVFQQKAPEDWEPVIEKVSQALAPMVAGK